MVVAVSDGSRVCAVVDQLLACMGWHGHPQQVIRNVIQLVRILSLWDAPETRGDATAVFQTMVFSSSDWQAKCLVVITWILLAIVLYVW